MVNFNGASNPALKKMRKPFNWEAFDALPRQIKEFIWESPERLGVERAISLPAFLKQKPQIEMGWRLAAEKTYGKDHPQAQKRAFKPSDIDEILSSL